MFPPSFGLFPGVPAAVAARPPENESQLKYYSIDVKGTHLRHPGYPTKTDPSR
jgi:hypothetical protein